MKEPTDRDLFFKLILPREANRFAEKASVSAYHQLDLFTREGTVTKSTTPARPLCTVRVT